MIRTHPEPSPLKGAARIVQKSLLPDFSEKNTESDSPAESRRPPIFKYPWPSRCAPSEPRPPCLQGRACSCDALNLRQTGQFRHFRYATIALPSVKNGSFSAFCAVIGFVTCASSR
jgi:hypothetical protein